MSGEPMSFWAAESQPTPRLYRAQQVMIVGSFSLLLLATLLVLYLFIAPAPVTRSVDVVTTSALCPGDTLEYRVSGEVRRATNFILAWSIWDVSHERVVMSGPGARYAFYPAGAAIAETETLVIPAGLAAGDYELIQVMGRSIREATGIRVPFTVRTGCQP